MYIFVTISYKRKVGLTNLGEYATLHHDGMLRKERKSAADAAILPQLLFVLYHEIDSKVCKEERDEH